MTRGPDLTYHPVMRHLICLAVVLVASCGSDDGPGSGDTTLEWKIHSDALGDRDCQTGEHVDWVLDRTDGGHITRSYNCTESGVTLTLSDGTYTKVEGTLRSPTAQIIATCDPPHDNPFTGASRNVDECVFNLP